jgi:ribosomal protein S18 acetylase RimI-like enzyme
MSEGVQLRPATPEDHARIVELGQAEDLHYRGLTDFTREELETQIIGQSSFDLKRDLVVGELEEVIVGAGVIGPLATFMLLDPAYESPPLRTAFLEWTEARQRELGRDAYRITAYAAAAPSIEVIRAAGYRLERVYSNMVRTFAESGPPEPAELPAGYRARLIDVQADAAVLHALNERAFAERADHAPDTLEDYTSAHLTFSQFDPATSLLIESPEGEPAGSLIGWRPPEHPHGYVAILAVDPGHRRRGLGRALLLLAFAAMVETGLPAAELHVASDNPTALALYTGVGMHENERIESYIRTP